MINAPAPREWPLADEVAKAIVAAARIFSESPIAIAEGRNISRARVYAFGVLAHRFPQLSHPDIARLVGSRDPKNPPSRSFVPFATSILRDSYAPPRNWARLNEINRVTEALGWPPMTRDEMKIYRTKEQTATAARSAKHERAAENLAKLEAAGNPTRLSDKQLQALLKKPIDQIRAERAEALERMGKDGPSRTESTKTELRQPGEIADGEIVLVDKRHPLERAFDPMPASLPAPVDIPRLPVLLVPAFNTMPASVLDTPSPPERDGLPPLPSRALIVKPTASPRVPAAPARAAFDLSSPVVAYKPDAPLADRADVDMVTAEFCGDPPLARSALAQRQAEDARKAAKER